MKIGQLYKNNGYNVGVIIKIDSFLFWINFGNHIHCDIIDWFNYKYSLVTDIFDSEF